MKLLLKTPFNRKISAFFSPLQRNAFVQWVVINTDTHNGSKSREHVIDEWTALNGVSNSQSLLPVLREHYGRRGRL